MIIDHEPSLFVSNITPQVHVTYTQAVIGKAASGNKQGLNPRSKKRDC